MIGALVRIFGVHNLALAEDVVQDAFCRAADIWARRGVPENPFAWLMVTAKNRALDVMRRQRTARNYAPEYAYLLDSEWTRASVVDDLFSPAEIRDDLLRMMFSCCQPLLPEEAQVMLMLHVLCGFSVDEIAGAFVSTQSAIEKRITRSKKVLAASKRLFDVTQAADVAVRLPAVQRTLYLLFNEGYHGASSEAAMRTDLCREAMRLAALLLQHASSATPTTYALAAGMCMNAARLPARLDANGDLATLAFQDRSLWDRTLMGEGLQLLAMSAKGTNPTSYHFEAAIAAEHVKAASVSDTDWAAIVGLYDQLQAIAPSPIVALNRAIAVGQSDGPQPGLDAVFAIRDLDRLERYPFYFATLGDFELKLGHFGKAHNYYTLAQTIARNPEEARFFGSLAAGTDTSGMQC